MVLNIKQAIEKAEKFYKGTGIHQYLYNSNNGFAVMDDVKLKDYPMVKVVYDTKDQLYSNRKVKLIDGEVIGFE